jgi:uncharacterized YccA/Bax inhibitor family protein
MALFKTSNPALSDKTFSNLSGTQYGSGSGIIDVAGRMTLSGTVHKTGLLLLCCTASAIYTWHLFLAERNIQAVLPLMVIGLVVGFILAMITVFKKTWSPVTAPLYALAEGLVLGGLSAVIEVSYPGIAIEAVSLTFGTLLMLLMLYSSGIIKVTEKFRLGIFAATGGLIGIGFSVFVVIIAALNLVLDFDFIERGVQAGAPKFMEWYGAFSIMVTLVWLYLEILRLLSKLRSRN